MKLSFFFTFKIWRFTPFSVWFPHITLAISLSCTVCATCYCCPTKPSSCSGNFFRFFQHCIVYLPMSQESSPEPFSRNILICLSTTHLLLSLWDVIIQYFMADLEILMFVIICFCFCSLYSQDPYLVIIARKFYHMTFSVI